MTALRSLLGILLCACCCLSQPTFATQHKHKRVITTHTVTHSKKSKHAHKKKRQKKIAEGRSPSVIYGTQNLIAALNHIVFYADPGATIGVQIKSMRQGDVLYGQNQSRLFVPASTMKILTAEAALLYLGPDFSFNTRFLTDAKTVEQGVLDGSIYLVHSGDPTLTYADLYDLMEQLQAHGVRHITGHIYIDNTAYDQENTGPGWNPKDKKYCYAAPVNASIINRNCAQNSGPISNVVGYNQLLMQSLFSQFNIQVDNHITTGRAPSYATVIASHQSKPLRFLITDMLKKSDNIIAGSLLKKMGELYSKEPGSWENGGIAIRQILASNTGMNPKGIDIIDGSGLSRDNQITPAQMMQVLDFAYHHPSTNYDFISALPIAGVDGTLKHRLYNVAGKVRAKTGTMSGVVSLAGYMITQDKEPIAFVIMVNGRNGLGWKYKSVEDKIVTAIAKYSRGEQLKIQNVL